MVNIRWGATTNPGRVRSENEDTFVAEAGVFAVADGMGGHQAGEIASALAASIVRDRLGGGATSETDAVSVVNEANAAIHGAARANPAQSGMGTTLTALTVLTSQDATPEQLVLLNVGDSRTYRFRSGKLQRVTVDHSYVQELVASGHITIEEARTHPRRNIVTRALGIEPNVRTDWWTLPIVRGDRFILCSDGLVDEVPDDEILQLVSTVGDPQLLSEQLVELANHHGGRDNVTVVVVDIIDGADPPDPTEELALDPVWAEGVGEPSAWADDQPATSSEDSETTVDEAERAAEITQRTASAMPTVPPPAAPLPGLPTLPPRERTVADTAEIPATPVAHEEPQAAPDTTSSVSVDAPAANAGDAIAKPVASVVSADAAAKPATAKPTKRRKHRLTGGVFLFVVLLAAIITVTLTLVAVHARSGYYVGFDNDTVVVYKGQPGGVLWFDPTVYQTSTIKRSDLKPEQIAVINEHSVFDSAEEAARAVTAFGVPTTTTEPATTTTAEASSSTTTASTAVGETTPTVPSGP
jgi:serine/threonine protein phosphatase PrpC